MDQTSREAASPSSSTVFEQYLLVHNVSKKANIGTLARCATAFGVKELIIAGGSRHINTFGSHGASEYVQFRYFPKLEEAVGYLKEKGVEIIGIEIKDGASDVTSRPFRGHTCFMLGNEGSGMTEKQFALCDRFVYIPQFGPGTASLNVAVAASIVLHHFATWAGYSERAREGFKFVVDERPQKTQPRGMIPLTEEEMAEKIAARRARKEGAEGGSSGDDAGVIDLFGEGEAQHGEGSDF